MRAGDAPGILAADRPVKSLHLTNAYHPTSGGIRTFYRALLDVAARQGRHMALVVPGEHDGIEPLSATTRLYLLRSPRSPIFDTNYRLMLPHRFLCPWRNRLRAILAHERPDLVEINDKYSLCYLAGALRKRWWPEIPRPTLVGHSSERTDDNLFVRIGGSRSARRFARWYMRRIYVPLFDYHVANSPYTADEIVESLPDWRRGHASWLPMGIEPSHYGPHRRDEDVRRRWRTGLDRSGTATLLAYAGRLSPEKRVGDLIGMLEEVGRAAVECRLVVAGDGPLRRVLEIEASRRAPGRVVWLGHLEADGLARLLASVDLFVHPNDREPFGITPLEAMASGTPVVVPAAGGVLSYASPDTAWLTEPTGAGLAEGVLRALAWPEERRRRAERARARAQAFAWPRVAERWFAAYDALSRRGVVEWRAEAHGVLGVGEAGEGLAGAVHRLVARSTPRRRIDRLSFVWRLRR